MKVLEERQREMRERDAVVECEATTEAVRNGATTINEGCSSVTEAGYLAVASPS
jgi:hypothetical protein